MYVLSMSENMVPVCARCICMWVWKCQHPCAYACGGQKNMWSGLLHYSLPRFFETGPLTEPGAGLVASKPQLPSCLHQILYWGYRQVRPRPAFYMSVASKLRYSHKCFYPQSHLSLPYIRYFFFKQNKLTELSTWLSNKTETMRTLIDMLSWKGEIKLSLGEEAELATRW